MPSTSRRGVARMQLGHAAHLVKHDLDRAVALLPSFGYSYASRARYHCRNDVCAFRDAERDARAAVSLLPGEWLGHFYLAFSLHCQHDTRQALQVLASFTAGRWQNDPARVPPEHKVAASALFNLMATCHLHDAMACPVDAARSFYAPRTRTTFGPLRTASGATPWRRCRTPRTSMPYLVRGVDTQNAMFTRAEPLLLNALAQLSQAEAADAGTTAIDLRCWVIPHDRGIIHLCMGNYAQAMSEFQRAASVAQGFGSYCVNAQGLVHANQGQWKQALEKFDQAIALDRGLPVVHVNRVGAHDDGVPGRGVGRAQHRGVAQAGCRPRVHLYGTSGCAAAQGGQRRGDGRAGGVPAERPVRRQRRSAAGGDAAGGEAGGGS
eukprot:TRINITY_DN13353_c0_g3_i1.p1 TRINITY_DN13353_c0_g3~~TRINITY_DN13353_c0_g3_i1.p1  ORF type:complete len:379 (+),score=37.02 TRINITY_DN13353_c0_g3_i1:247-1383(+)